MLINVPLVAIAVSFRFQDMMDVRSPALCYSEKCVIPAWTHKVTCNNKHQKRTRRTPLNQSFAFFDNAVLKYSHIRLPNSPPPSVTHSCGRAVTDAVLTALTKGCRGLRKISLRGVVGTPPPLGAVGILAVCVHCRALECLDLSDVPDLDDSALACFHDHQMEALARASSTCCDVSCTLLQGIYSTDFLTCIEVTLSLCCRRPSSVETEYLVLRNPMCGIDGLLPLEHITRSPSPPRPPPSLVVNIPSPYPVKLMFEYCPLSTMAAPNREKTRK